MNKLKQVFTHDEHKSPSGHFTTESSDEAHRSSHDSTDRSTGSNILSGSNERSSVGTSSTHGTTPTHTSAGDRISDAAAGAAAATSSSSATRSPTTATHGTSTHGTGVGAKVANATEHIHEHAHPPGHRHNQPTQDGILSEKDAKLATHDHQHLAPVTHETRHHHEVEEVERQREIDRHVHHVQHHVQPVLDTQHSAEQHTQKNVPVTEIRENHVATDEDKAQFAALGRERDTVAEAAREKTIIDKGEKVIENKHDHVHHLVQPVIERDVHTHAREHTTVPIHQETHEAPIVHQSQQHAPLRMEEFVQGGGDLKSTLRHDANLLNVNGQDCERQVDGPAETLVSNLGLSSGQQTSSASTTGATPSTTSAQGTTGGAL